MEALLAAWLPTTLPERVTFSLHPFGGKPDLLAKLRGRLRAYAKWLPQTSKIVVLLDQDNEKCLALKAKLEAVCGECGLATRRASPTTWRVATCIAIEELEAWFFGDWEAVRTCHPRAPANVVGKKRFRDSDAIAGGTWEQFEKVMQNVGYYEAGLEKVRAAREIGAHLSADRSSSRSFLYLARVLSEATAAGDSC